MYTDTNTHTQMAKRSQLSTAVMISQLHYNSNNTTTQTFAGNFKYIGVRVCVLQNATISLALVSFTWARAQQQ